MSGTRMKYAETREEKIARAVKEEVSVPKQRVVKRGKFGQLVLRVGKDGATERGLR